MPQRGRRAFPGLSRAPARPQRPRGEIAPPAGCGAANRRGFLSGCGQAPARGLRPCDLVRLAFRRAGVLAPLRSPAACGGAPCFAGMRGNSIMEAARSVLIGFPAARCGHLREHPLAAPSGGPPPRARATASGACTGLARILYKGFEGDKVARKNAFVNTALARRRTGPPENTPASAHAGGRFFRLPGPAPGMGGHRLFFPGPAREPVRRSGTVGGAVARPFRAEACPG